MRHSELVKSRSAFTLIEMLVATVLAAILMMAVLTMLAGVSRDRKMLHGLRQSQSNSGLEDLLRWDLTNSRSIATTTDDQSVVLTGIGGIDNASRVPNGRLVQVRYEIKSKNLWRTQEYLDTPSRNGNWRELVAANVSSITVEPSTRYVRLRIAMPGDSVDENLWIK